MRRRALAGAALFIALVPCLPRLSARLDEGEKRGAAHLPEHYSLPPAGIVRALSFGYNELGADLLWVRSVGYFADHLFGDRDMRHLERYLDTLLALDPRFEAPYRYGPTMIISGSGERTPAEVWAAIRLLKRAVTVFPDSWRYPFFLGSYYLTELRTKDRKLRAAWRREGADWVNRAALLGEGSSWLPNLAAKIYSEQGQRDVAIRHLQELYVTTQNPNMKTQIAGELKHLQASQSLEQARTAAEAMARAQGESGLGFVPPDLFGLMWLDPLPPFSLR